MTFRVAERSVSFRVGSRVMVTAITSNGSIQRHWSGGMGTIVEFDDTSPGHDGKWIVYLEDDLKSRVAGEWYIREENMYPVCE